MVIEDKDLKEQVRCLNNEVRRLRKAIALVNPDIKVEVEFVSQTSRFEEMISILSKDPSLRATIPEWEGDKDEYIQNTDWLGKFTIKQPVGTEPMTAQDFVNERYWTIYRP